MASVGIICEYNPFHNGHLYHLNIIKQKYPDDVIVLVLSGNFTQRGDFSIIDKWKKVEIAKKMGIDLIVELPFPFATQSADFFSYGAVTILEKLHVDKLVFGSETDNIDDLIKIAKCQIDNEDFDILVKLYSKSGLNYPSAINKAIYDLTGTMVDTPNNLLGVSYVKTILQNGYKIEPICIKRINDYHSLELSDISSATAIRKALKEGKSVSDNVPPLVLPYLSELHFRDDYFSYLKYKIITDEKLDRYQSVDEGIEKRLKKVINECENYEDIINKIKSKRYTYNRISRMLLHILIGFTKEQALEMKDVNYIRILGFDAEGQNYLKKIKKNCDVKILSKFEKNFDPILDLELQATTIYNIICKNNELVKAEYKNHLKKEDLC